MRTLFGISGFNFSDRVARAALMLLPVAAAWFFAPQLANAFEIKHHIVYLGAVALVLTLLWAGKIEGLSLPRGWVRYSVLAWLLGLGVSFIAAANAYLATRALLESAAGLLLATALCNLRDPGTALRTLERGIIIASLGVALYALKQVLLPDWLDPGFSALGKMQIYSTLGNPNLSALVILAGIAPAAGRVFHGEIFSRAVHALFTLLMLGGLAATQARHTLIALAVMALAALLWKGTPPVRRTAMALLAISACAIAAALLVAKLPPSLTHSIQGREFIWLTSLQMLYAHPLTGVGLGHYGISHMAYQGEMFTSGRFDDYFDNATVITEGHNDFLNWGATAGAAGLAGFTSLCAATLWLGWRSSHLKQTAPQFYLALCGQIAAMFFIAVTAYAVPALFFWLLLGATWACIGFPRFLPELRTGRRTALAALLAVLLAFDVPLAWNEGRGEYIEARGDLLMEEHDLWLARKEYLRALQWLPHNGRLRKKYATSLYLSGELPQALAELEAARRDSGDLGINLLEGELHARVGELDRAEAEYRQISAAFPNMVGAHFILGQIYQLQGRKLQAAAEFRRVLDIRPSPYNLNLTPEKVEMQKRIVRDYLETSGAAPEIAPDAPVPEAANHPG